MYEDHYTRKPVRISVQAFLPRSCHKRTLKKNAGIVDIDVTPYAVLDEERIDIYKDHLRGRFGTYYHHHDYDEGYYRLVMETNWNCGFEIQYRVHDELVGVGLSSPAEGMIVADYFAYKMAYKHLSLGTYNVLVNIAVCKVAGIPYLYLGPSDTDQMSYKRNFGAHQVYADGCWVDS